MVSRVPTWSGKLIGQRIPRDMVAAALRRRSCSLVALLVSFPWETMPRADARLSRFAAAQLARIPAADKGTVTTAAASAGDVPLTIRGGPGLRSVERDSVTASQ